MKIVCKDISYLNNLSIFKFSCILLLLLLVNKIFDSGMSEFSKYIHFLTNLTCLDLRNNYIGDKSLKDFTKKMNFLPKLITLDISGNLINNSAKDLIHNLHYCSKLKNLNVNSSFTNINNVVQLYNSVKSNALNVSNSEIDSIGLEYLFYNISNLVNLVSLNLCSMIK